MVPSGQWTFEKKGFQHVSIIGLDDKREITVLLVVSMAGEALPGQVIYQGTTNRCHPKYEFPGSWNITHTASHWSTENTTLEYIKTVLGSYFCMKRKELGLSEKHQGLLIVDVFRAHRTDAVRKALEDENVYVLYVLTCYTDNLQPLDLTVNKSLKKT